MAGEAKSDKKDSRGGSCIVTIAPYEYPARSSVGLVELVGLVLC